MLGGGGEEKKMAAFKLRPEEQGLQRGSLLTPLEWRVDGEGCRSVVTLFWSTVVVKPKPLHYVSTLAPGFILSPRNHVYIRNIEEQT